MFLLVFQDLVKSRCNVYVDAMLQLIRHERAGGDRWEASGGAGRDACVL